MRKRFEQQLSLGTVLIGEVEINLKSRHELPPVLVALQYLFTDEGVNEKIFALLEKRIMAGKKRTGRPGMSLWEIFVLAVVRLCLDVDYDFLLDQANNHNELRGILGVQMSDFSPGKVYQYQTLVDNITLLDEATLVEINELVVKSGHSILKKRKALKRKRAATAIEFIDKSGHLRGGNQCTFSNGHKFDMGLCKEVSGYDKIYR